MAKDDVRTHLDLAQAYAEMELWRDARAEVGVVLEHEPGNSVAIALLAIVAADL